MKTTFLKTLLISTIVISTVPSYGCNDSKVSTENNSTMNNNEEKNIEATVKAYILGGDEQSVEQLEQVLHNNYRVIINDTKEQAIKELDKSTYLDFIAKKIFGGTPRAVTIESIEVANHLNATVKLTLKSDKAIFHSLFSLVKADGKWWIVQDLVHMESK